MKKYEIVKKKTLTPEISQISVYAPLVAAKAKAGQFIILRVDEAGERIPLTISSAEDGLVTVIFQKIGGTTMALDELNEGDCLQDFVGPLGLPTEVDNVGRVAVLGGGRAAGGPRPASGRQPGGPHRRFPDQGYCDPGGRDEAGLHRPAHLHR